MGGEEKGEGKRRKETLTMHHNKSEKPRKSFGEAEVAWHSVAPNWVLGIREGPYHLLDYVAPKEDQADLNLGWHNWWRRVLVLPC